MTDARSTASASPDRRRLTELAVRAGYCRARQHDLVRCKATTCKGCGALTNMPCLAIDISEVLDAVDDAMSELEAALIGGQR